MSLTLTAAAINLSVALGCGAVIGMERQIRQRKAGLRTNALVALGAAAFMVFSMEIDGDMSPSRVAAQVVSGIGFLGAGIIFRDGFNVQGLTTAATLWCSAAVGLLAGHGNWDVALLTMALVVFVNFALRPFVQWMKRRTGQKSEDARHFRVTVTVQQSDEAGARSLMLRQLGLGGMHFGGISMTPSPETGTVELTATVSADGTGETMLEQAVQRIGAEPGFLRVDWQMVDEG
ncbi:MgtC/SapB family protein [Xinfangfangia sp. CPCC 101601]|uniref:Protein MgtC n=1 Tax=Pseudogemmobacter lacusdianii TaxID=3069608 RepID=A0ABU0VV15_9RHOB|nr:MgtC/SapB family protein [Xinfangfangia sp. CPCC 101601]MDQ2065582.1 MgtC/SapB family protein [Xinfangfangia sp. CPCC 101601]